MNNTVEMFLYNGQLFQEGIITFTDPKTGEILKASVDPDASDVLHIEISTQEKPTIEAILARKNLDRYPILERAGISFGPLLVQAISETHTPNQQS